MKARCPHRWPWFAHCPDCSEDLAHTEVGPWEEHPGGWLRRVTVYFNPRGALDGVTVDVFPKKVSYSARLEWGEEP